MPIDRCQAWRIADRAAIQASRAATRQALLALAGQGEPPTARQTAEARRLRELANALLLDALAAMRAAAAGSGTAC